VWLFADPRTIHIGASGLIFGLLGYLLLRAYFERSLSSIFIALVVAVLYGGAIFGVLPGQRGVSWEGHLFGFLSGVAAARFLIPSPQIRRGAFRDVRYP
jgi:membrane associated rhomboid family serine protease